MDIYPSEGGYPFHVTFTDGRGGSITIDHKHLLKLEMAVLEAKRLAMMSLDRRHWHEIDPRLVGGSNG